MSSASDDLLVVEEGTSGDTVAAAEPSLPPKSTKASGLSTKPLQGQSGPSSRSLVTKCLQKARAAASQCLLQWQFCFDLELPQSKILCSDVMNAEEAEYIAHRSVNLSFQFNIPMSARYKLDICMSCHVLSINSLEPLDPCPRCCYQKHCFGIIFMLSGPLSHYPKESLSAFKKVG